MCLKSLTARRKSARKCPEGQFIPGLRTVNEHQFTMLHGLWNMGTGLAIRKGQSAEEVTEPEK